MIVRVYTNLFQSEDGWRLVVWFSVVPQRPILR